VLTGSFFGSSNHPEITLKFTLKSSHLPRGFLLTGGVSLEDPPARPAEWLPDRCWGELFRLAKSKETFWVTQVTQEFFGAFHLGRFLLGGRFSWVGIRFFFPYFFRFGSWWFQTWLDYFSIYWDVILTINIFQMVETTNQIGKLGGK
jgi:hypothetical protein